LRKFYQSSALKVFISVIVAIVLGAVIAALYTALTYLCTLFGLSSGVIQLRVSEALCILPAFMPEAIPGLFIGCLVSNILTGCVITDIIFGSIATLVGAIGTYLLRKHPILATLPPILANTFIIPFVLMYAYHLEGALWYFFLTIFIGEVISCGILGYLLEKSLNKRDIFKSLQ
jgi:uncharacterized membrane protein